MKIKVFTEKRVEVGFYEDIVNDFLFSDKLDGVGVSYIIIESDSILLQQVQPNNIMEFYSDDDELLHTAVVSSFYVEETTARINLLHIKNIFNNLYFTSDITINNVSQLLNAIQVQKGINYTFNLPDITFGDIDIKAGDRLYTILEKVRKATSYDWDFQNYQLVFGRIGRDRTDIEFTDDVSTQDCSSSPSMFGSDVRSEFVKHYTKIICIGKDGTIVTSGTGCTEKVIKENSSDDITFLQNVADEELINSSLTRVVTFDIPNVGDNKIDVGDRVSVSIDKSIDILDVSSEVRILKKEIFPSGCNIGYKIYVGEVKAEIPDEYNSLINQRDS